jgi:hypothetical protein
VQCDVTKFDKARNSNIQADHLAGQICNIDLGLSPDSLLLESPMASILVNSAEIMRDTFLKKVSDRASPDA